MTGRETRPLRYVSTRFLRLPLRGSCRKATEGVFDTLLPPRCGPPSSRRDAKRNAKSITEKSFAYISIKTDVREGFARVRSTIAGVAETGGICKGAKHHCRRRRDGWAEIHQRRENPLTRLHRELSRRESLKEEKSCILYR